MLTSVVYIHIVWLKANVRYLCVLFVGPALSHLTKLDDSLLPRAEALRDFTATNSSHLSFRVCYSAPHHTLLTTCDRGRARNFPPIRASFEL